MKRIIDIVSDWDELLSGSPDDGVLRVIRENGAWYTVVWYNRIPRAALCSFEQLTAMGVTIDG